jgi:PDZ domain-containing protein
MWTVLRMSRRTWASLLAVVLVVGLSVGAVRKSVPYVTFSPGPTLNVLADDEGKQIITVKGHRTYRDDGALRLTTVVPSGPSEKVSLPTLVTAWLDPDRAVFPRRTIYGQTDTRKSVREQSAAQMASSQDNAVAAALGALDIPFTTKVGVATVEAGGPADGKLEPGDTIVAVDGKDVKGVSQVTDAIRPLPVGSDVTLTVRRGDRLRDVELTTTSAPDDDQASAVRVSIQAAGYTFPFQVDLKLADNIGGPSAGTMFALGVYDVLTPGSLTGGKTIAGTGEIDGEGHVGPIGGIQQKLVGAQDAGARLFLVPADNCAEALDGHYDPDKMRLVKVSTLEGAIEDVQAWAKDPDADLPRCTRGASS